MEAELAAIAGGADGQQLRKKTQKQIVSLNELDKMIADSLGDEGSEDDDNEELENDTDLLGELQGIVSQDSKDDLKEVEPLEPGREYEKKTEIILPTSNDNIMDVINLRIELYKVAEENAKAVNDSSKMRRFNRGLKTLNDLLKQVKSGKVVHLDDIPPEVSVKKTDKIFLGESQGSEAPDRDVIPALPTRRAPSPPKPQEESDKPEESVSASKLLIQQMRSRQQEYIAAALQSKHAGDKDMAIQFLKIVKQFDFVVKMCEDGKEVDLSDMPPPPAQFKEFMQKLQAAAIDSTSTTEPTSEPEPISKSTCSPTNDMLESLQQRLNKYKSVEESAKAEGNASKARRFARIVKQYEDAISSYNAGRPVQYDELPVPPGFGPLPTLSSPTISESDRSGSTNPSSNISSTDVPHATLVKKPSDPPRHNDLTTRTSGNQQKNNLAEQQMKILIERQKEFKFAAIEAKKSGEIDQAKEYLKIYKGFDALLNAASSGLPVDLNTVSFEPILKLRINL